MPLRHDAVIAHATIIGEGATRHYVVCLSRARSDFEANKDPDLPARTARMERVGNRVHPAEGEVDTHSPLPVRWKDGWMHTN